MSQWHFLKLIGDICIIWVSDRIWIAHRLNSTQPKNCPFISYCKKKKKESRKPESFRLHWGHDTWGPDWDHMGPSELSIIHGPLRPYGTHSLWRWKSPCRGIRAQAFPSLLVKHAYFSLSSKWHYGSITHDGAFWLKCALCLDEQVGLGKSQGREAWKGSLFKGKGKSHLRGKYYLHVPAEFIRAGRIDEELVRHNDYDFLWCYP